MSLDDERRAVSQLICTYIHKVNYGNNFEQQLNFYVDSRANFTNLDPVITELVQVGHLQSLFLLFLQLLTIVTQAISWSV